MTGLVARLPAWLRTQPMDVLVAVLCLQSGAATALGAGSGPLELLPRWAAWLWVACLLAGAVCWLAGLSSVREDAGRLVASRLPVLRLGLWLLSTATAVYGVALALVGGWPGAAAGTWLLFAAGLFAVRRAGLDAGGAR